jgi:putative tryptophan/tyrosine transport system substrate-binding protein
MSPAGTGSKAERTGIGSPAKLWRAEMRRREFIAGLGSVTAWPLAGRTQQSAVPVIGWLDWRLPGAPRDFIEAFMVGLAEKGFAEGRNVAMEYRYAEDHAERLPMLAAELVRRNVALIVAPSAQSATAAGAATQTIPIIFTAGSDPVEIGLVPSLNRPGGNVTGVNIMAIDIAGKRLDLLRKLVPTAESVALLSGSPNSNYTRAEIRDVQSAAAALGVRLLVLNAAFAHEIEAAFATLVGQHVGALLIGASTPLDAARRQIIALAARHAIPTMFFYGAAVPEGGLLSYGSDVAEAFRQAGAYAGRILQGEKPGELPVVRSIKFEFVINLQTAKALGLQIPPTVLALADRVIE